jgi:hypothetical protein
MGNDVRLISMQIKNDIEITVHPGGFDDKFLPRSILEFLLEVFYSDIICCDIDPNEVKNIINEITVDKYKEYLINSDANKYNL